MRIVDTPTIHPSIRKLLALATSKDKVEIELLGIGNFKSTVVNKKECFIGARHHETLLFIILLNRIPLGV
jgi:hypothetical protein